MFDSVSGTQREIIVPGSITSCGVKKYKADTGTGPFLFKNRFDYRMADQSGVQVEPLKQFTLRLNAKHRFEETLDPKYFRLVQNTEHWPCRGIVREGIYSANFGHDSASPTTIGMSLNLSQLENKEFNFRSNTVNKGLQGTDGSVPGVHLGMNLFLEYYQVLVQENGVISSIYAN